MRTEIANIAELYRRVSELENRISNIAQDVMQNQNLQYASAVNLLNNSDFLYSESAYNNYMFMDSADVLAEWYTYVFQETPFQLNTNLIESPRSIRSDVHPNPRVQAIWLKSRSAIGFGGLGRGVFHPISKPHIQLGNQIYYRFGLGVNKYEYSFNLAIPSNTITIGSHVLQADDAIRFRGSNLPSNIDPTVTYYVVSVTTTDIQISTSIGGTPITVQPGDGTIYVVLDTNVELYVFLYSNLDSSVVISDPPDLFTSRVGASGSFVRQYIVEFELLNGATFTTSTISFVTGQNQIFLATPANTYSVTNYAIVSIPHIPYLRKWSLYRSDGSQWYYIGTFSRETVQYSDFGGGGISLGSAPPFKAFSVEQKITVLKEELADTDALLDIRGTLLIPTSVVTSMSDLLFCIKTTNVKTNRLLLLDRVLLSFGFGRWSPSSKDLTVTSTPPAPTNPPTTTGGGQPTFPPELPPSRSCIRSDMYVMTPVGRIRVGDLKIGVKILGIGDNGKVEYMRVTGIKSVKVKKLVKVVVLDEVLYFSLSHQVFESFTTFKPIVKVDNILCYKNEKCFTVENSYSIVDDESEVIQLELEGSKRFVVYASKTSAVGVVSHNTKPVGIEF